MKYGQSEKHDVLFKELDSLTYASNYFPAVNLFRTHDGVSIEPVHQNYFGYNALIEVAKFCEQNNYSFSVYGRASGSFTQSVAIEVQFS